MRKLSEQARQARNNYVRNWRLQNKEKVRKANDRYWERRAKHEAEKNNEDQK